MPYCRFLIPILILIAGCAGTPEDETFNAAEYPKGDAKMHTVHSKKLLETMQRLNILSRNRDAPVRESDERRNEYLQNLIDTAGEVVVAAEALDKAGPEGDMDRNERAVFHTMAERLYVEAANIEIQARDSNFMELQEAYRRLDETCNDCHRLFRDR